MPKRIVINKIGKPEVLIYEEYNLKKVVKNNFVRIKHNSIGINYIDNYHRSGLYPLNLEFPICLGLEASGEIIDIGKTITIDIKR